MKARTFIIAAVFTTSLWAQPDDADEYAVILPDAAQQCVLPAAPDAIPEEASYEQLVEAKKGVSTFQGEIEVYRGCLRESEELPDNTEGNKQAIIASFNYSVEMEERVAERFNEAVRAYKARKDAEG